MKRGFTLIELLAVIVILAIIALIATPIILNIIDETKDNASLRSVEFYLDAVEQSILIAELNSRRITDGVYNVINGDICLNNNCTDKLVIEVKGEKPNNGTITITKGKIEDILLNLNDKEIVFGENGGLSFLTRKYEIGEEVIFNPGDVERTWNVIDEGVNTVTLMLTENLGETVAWYAEDNDNSYGPKDALEYLNTLTVNWDNVEPIKNYSYINNLNGPAKPNGYQKIEIENGKTRLTQKDGAIITEVSWVSKARLLTIEEVFEIAQKTNVNLKEENLRAYIESHLSAINEVLQSEGYEKSATTVDEAISLVIKVNTAPLMNAPFHYKASWVISRFEDEQGIEPKYDMSFPGYMYQNLDADSSTTLPYGYWTLSSDADTSNYAWRVNAYGYLPSSSVNSGSTSGVRPVITVLKSKLTK